jgi:hypothetical protein
MAGSRTVAEGQVRKVGWMGITAMLFLARNALLKRK